MKEPMLSFNTFSLLKANNYASKVGGDKNFRTLTNVPQKRLTFVPDLLFEIIKAKTNKTSRGYSKCTKVEKYSKTENFVVVNEKAFSVRFVLQASVKLF